MYNLVCEGKPHRETFGQRRYGIVVAPHKDGVMFEVQKRDGTTGRRQVLPYRELVQDWCLMQFRLARIGAELGDVTSIHRCDNPAGAYHCDKYLELIGEERLQYTIAAPLKRLLADPVPF
jgi:hypothetical protein